LIYIVSGFMRTLSTGMMRAIEAGGIPAARNKVRDKLIGQTGDEHYQMNPESLYELHRSEYWAEDFPDKYEGMVVKFIRSGPLRLKAADNPYRVVFMWRDYEEIRQSLQAWMKRPERADELVEEAKHVMPLVSGILRQRRDVVLTELWCRDVWDRPLDAFTKLVNEGWPIDPNKAAATIDSKLCRYKIEDLDIGA